MHNSLIMLHLNTKNELAKLTNLNLGFRIVTFG